ncbi:MAG: ethanolamine utilization protein EutH [Acutalibacteraceae bacterium]|nr:ethanolamine utilization protein EutH [Acutalibacteraceae bacterium]
MNAISVVLLVFAIIGAVDRIFGNRFGLGVEFERGFKLFGAMALSMIGMIVLAPALSSWLSPFFDEFYNTFGLDPSILPASFFSSDMGGATLSQQVSKSSVIGDFNGFVVASMMGCVISFTVPLALDVVNKEHHKEMFFGFLCGIVTIPLGCFVSGLICRISVKELVLNLLPLITLALIIAVGLIFLPQIFIKCFKVFGIFMRILITVGLALGIFAYITKKPIGADFDTYENGALICAGACVTLAGAFPLMSVISRVLRIPISKLGEKLKIDEVSAGAFISTVVTNVNTLSLMNKMNKKGIVLNSAFAVSAAFSLGGQFGFTMTLSPSYAVPMIIGKLISGISALILACILYKDKTA